MPHKREHSSGSIGVYEIETQEGRRLIGAADVIIGRDVMSQREFVVFGRKALRRAAKGQQKAYGLVVLLDQDTEELEYLCAACQVLKGTHEYRPS
jgi:hypothetical protein